MVIVDTGVLVALLSQRDQYHAWAVACAVELPLPWSTCEAVLSETYHRISASPRAREGLLKMIRRGALAFPFALPPSLGHMADLLEKYTDLPTSVADANLLLMAERMPGSQIWTTDRDFLVYRLSGKKAPTVLLPD
jgi:predicted nucleic acid-binding protein